MNKYLITALCVSFSVFHVDHMLAQKDTVAIKYADLIDTKELQKHLTILASDEYEGRETGTKGQKMAAQYIAEYYNSIGVQPVVNGSYFQSYPLKKESYSNSMASFNNESFKFVQDFYTMGVDFETLETDEFIFLGYGIEDKKYNDYKKYDVKGKVVLCLLGEPLDKEGKSLITGTLTPSDWSADWRTKREIAQQKGAKAIVMINMQYAMYIQRVKYWLEQPAMDLEYPSKREITEPSIATVFISPAFANKLFSAKKVTVEQLQKNIAIKKKSKKIVLKEKLSFHMELKSERLSAENVLCFIEGSDPVLKNEIVVISAHYDHIGIVNGQINNGADDDGSGTVTTLELAKAFKKATDDGNGPKRSILILNVSGEEKGLLGSEWYAAFPIYPLENTVCNLNIDMIGRTDDAHKKEEYVYLIGSNKLSTELHAISENANKTYTNLELDYTYNDPDDPNRFYYRSDHYNFAKNNIPVIFYFSGVHADYHKPGDDVEKIRFEKMGTIGKLVFHTAWEVANRPEKLKVDVTNDFKR